MSNWREHEQGMDEIDGDMGQVGAFQPHQHQDFDPKNLKNPEHMSSINDSGLGSMASISTSMGSCTSGTEAMMARMNLLGKIYDENRELLDDGYNSQSVHISEEYSPLKTREETKTQVREGSEEQQLEELLYTQDDDGDTKLHVAISQLSPMARSIIDLAPTVDHLNLYNKMALTPLHMAVITNQPGVVRHLVMMGARLEVRDAEGNSPLHIACREGYLDVVKALTIPLTGSELVHHAQAFPVQQIPQDLDLKNYDGYTCMHLCCQHQVQCDTLVYLIQELQADINARDGLSGRTVLHHAADVGDISTVLFLIKVCKANVNTCAYSGCKPLSIAAGRGHNRVVEILREAGTQDPDAETSTESEYTTDDEMIDDFTIGGRPVTTISS